MVCTFRYDSIICYVFGSPLALLGLSSIVLFLLTSVANSICLLTISAPSTVLTVDRNRAFEGSANNPCVYMTCLYTYNDHILTDIQIV
jgi:hypothetical protein